MVDLLIILTREHINKVFDARVVGQPNPAPAFVPRAGLLLHPNDSADDFR
jgi:hypothetical protein